MARSRARFLRGILSGEHGQLVVQLEEVLDRGLLLPGRRLADEQQAIWLDIQRTFQGVGEVAGIDEVQQQPVGRSAQTVLHPLLECAGIRRGEHGPDRLPDQIGHGPLQPVGHGLATGAYRA